MLEVFPLEGSGWSVTYSAMYKTEAWTLKVTTMMIVSWTRHDNNKIGFYHNNEKLKLSILVK